MADNRPQTTAHIRKKPNWRSPQKMAECVICYRRVQVVAPKWCECASSHLCPDCFVKMILPLENVDIPQVEQTRKFAPYFPSSPPYENAWLPFGRLSSEEVMARLNIRCPTCNAPFHQHCHAARSVPRLLHDEVPGVTWTLAGSGEHTRCPHCSEETLLADTDIFEHLLVACDSAPRPDCPFCGLRIDQVPEVVYEAGETLEHVWTAGYKKWCFDFQMHLLECQLVHYPFEWGRSASQRGKPAPRGTMPEIMQQVFAHEGQFALFCRTAAAELRASLDIFFATTAPYIDARNRRTMQNFINAAFAVLHRSPLYGESNWMDVANDMQVEPGRLTNIAVGYPANPLRGHTVMADSQSAMVFNVLLGFINKVATMWNPLVAQYRDKLEASELTRLSKFTTLLDRICVGPIYPRWDGFLQLVAGRLANPQLEVPLISMVACLVREEEPPKRPRVLAGVTP